LAVAEAMGVIQRGAADAMLAGGASSQLNPFDCIRHCVMGNISCRHDDPAAAMRPFDADRDGQVWGEGAAVFVLESRRHAEARGAEILATVNSKAAACDPPMNGSPGKKGLGLRRAMKIALETAGIDAAELGHINAHGLSTTEDDCIEAQAIHAVAPGVPVTAPKSYFGNLGAAGGAMEMAASALALKARLTPASLNYRHADPQCPVPVVSEGPIPSSKPSALLINRTSAGQAVAVVLTGPE
jgi:3-oxoacyl-[acyl-carrier-protein] synthase II